MKKEFYSLKIILIFGAITQKLFPLNFYVDFNGTDLDSLKDKLSNRMYFKCRNPNTLL